MQMITGNQTLSFNAIEPVACAELPQTTIMTLKFASKVEGFPCQSLLAVPGFLSDRSQKWCSGYLGKHSRSSCCLLQLCPFPLPICALSFGDLPMPVLTSSCYFSSSVIPHCVFWKLLPVRSCL